jgi:hypothetical protein
LIEGLRCAQVSNRARIAKPAQRGDCFAAGYRRVRAAGTHATSRHLMHGEACPGSIKPRQLLMGSSINSTIRVGLLRLVMLRLHDRQVTLYIKRNSG